MQKKKVQVTIEAAHKTKKGKYENKREVEHQEMESGRKRIACNGNYCVGIYSTITRSERRKKKYRLIQFPKSYNESSRMPRQRIQ